MKKQNAKLLYFCRRTCQDIQATVAFLCSRLKNPDKDNYKKLTRVIQYIRDTQDITLTIDADNNPQWWVDSSYMVHPDMKSHIGVLICKGCTYTASSKQKLNTKSSTEAELVAIDDDMGQMLWVRCYGSDAMGQMLWVRCYGSDTMDQPLFSSTRYSHTHNDNITGQVRNPEVVKWKENMTSQCDILFRDR